MKKLFPISIALNLALAIGIVLAWPKSPSAPPSESPAAVATTISSSESLPEKLAEPTLILITNAFRWSALESTNWDELITNLRSVECPERTIRDILFADAERRYANAEAATAEDLPFWLAGRTRAEATRRINTNRSAAQQAVIADIQRLFGVDWSPEESEVHSVQIQAMTRLIVGQVPDEVHERALLWIMSVVRQGMQFRNERDGLTLKSDGARWQQTMTARQEQLKLLFGDAAFEELLARSTAMEDLLERRSIHFDYQELTPTETRQASLAKAQTIGWLPDLLSLGRSSRPDEDEQTAALKDAMKNALTPEHYEEFVRVQDEAYRDILDVTRDANLPRSTAQKIYEIRTLAQAEYQRLNSGANEAGNASLQEIQATTAASIRELMGSDAFNKFTARDGQWVTNFTKL